jgi:hypothetical protein
MDEFGHHVLSTQRYPKLLQILMCRLLSIVGYISSSGVFYSLRGVSHVKNWIETSLMELK